MSEPLSKIPAGMRYYCGPEARLRRAIEGTVMSIFDGWSYEESLPRQLITTLFLSMAWVLPRLIALSDSATATVAC